MARSKTDKAAYQAAYYRKNREAILARRQEYYLEYRDDFRRRNREHYRRNFATIKATRAAYRRANPEKFAAHGAVRDALVRGELQRQACEMCGSDSNVRAHHDDYSRPLEVRWLCGSCHHYHHDPFGQVETSTRTAGKAVADNQSKRHHGC